MATLVLTTIGTAIGGPIGGAIGAVIGSQLDQRLLAPRRQGARLGALTVQTSAYGQPIPKLFGTLRVAGTVIWATDLREEQSNAGGGKGKPRTTSYSYSASFAVALSARPIRAVHRIWADGKLLRGAAGDWKSETGFRLHHGDESQEIDPLLAAVEGASGTPAYRGTAYVVFEDMQLADFGNRIPSLTFEVEADAAAVPLATIAAELAGGAIGGESGLSLGGYAAGGDSVRGAIETLSRALPFWLRDDGSRITLADDVPPAIALPADSIGAAAGAGHAPRRAFDREASGTLPDEVSVTYYEPARDYQAGLQRARRGGAGRRIETIELAAAMSASEAKATAERRLADGWARRCTATALVPWRWADLRPGDAVVLDDGTRWSISGWTLEKMVLELKLRGIVGEVSLPSGARPGRSTAAPDAVHGATTIALVDLPPPDETATVPHLWLAAAGVSRGWRHAAAIASSDGGASWADVGSTAAPAVIGTALDALGSSDPSLFDRENSVEVTLLNDAMLLIGRNDDALANGANMAMLGDELIQFGEAVSLGSARWRLSRLLRGRRGTEAEIANHVVGERFVLVETATLLPVEISSARLGSELRVIASGVADPIGVEASALVSGRALRPPSPVHLRAERSADGLRFGWTRRSRLGWGWTDGGEVPLGEEFERYRLTITPSSGVARTIEVDVPAYQYDSAWITADGAGEATMFTLTVLQIGTFGASLPATASFSANGDRA